MSTLNLLRQEFLKHLNAVATYNGDWRSIDIAPFMSAVYEYFRNRHIEEVTTFTPEEESQLKEDLPLAYNQLGGQKALENLIDHLGPKDVFDYAKYRSACQFLIDDIGQFVPDDSDKSDYIEGMLESFEDNDRLLELGGSDWEFLEYPREPVPEHNGVPESHEWWNRLVHSYDVGFSHYQ